MAKKDPLAKTHGAEILSLPPRPRCDDCHWWRRLGAPSRRGANAGACLGVGPHPVVVPGYAVETFPVTIAEECCALFKTRD